MSDAVIVSTARTPIGKAYRGASERHRRRDAGRACDSRTRWSVPGSRRAEVEDVVMGCALQQGATGGNVARQALLRAGLPVTMAGDNGRPAMLVGVAGDRDRLAVGHGSTGCRWRSAGGLESISLVQNEHMNIFHRQDRWLMAHKAEVYMPMIDTAEVVSARYGIGREAQDAYALESQRRTAAAQQAGRFDDRDRADRRDDDGGRPGDEGGLHRAR